MFLENTRYLTYQSCLPKGEPRSTPKARGKKKFQDQDDPLLTTLSETRVPFYRFTTSRLLRVTVSDDPGRQTSFFFACVCTARGRESRYGAERKFTRPPVDLIPVNPSGVARRIRSRDIRPTPGLGLPMRSHRYLPIRKRTGRVTSAYRVNYVN